MTLKEIEAKAKSWARYGYGRGGDGESIALALLAALSLISEARAHTDMAGAVAAFDKTIEGLGT